jgi:hypothetical protein
MSVSHPPSAALSPGNDAPLIGERDAAARRARYLFMLQSGEPEASPWRLPAFHPGAGASQLRVAMSAPV